MALPRSQWPSLVSSPWAKGRLHRGWGVCGQHGSGFQEGLLAHRARVLLSSDPGPPLPGCLAFTVGLHPSEQWAPPWFSR